MAKLEAELASLAARAAALDKKREAARVALDAATATRQTNLLEGDLTDEKLATKLQAAVDHAASTLNGLDAALNALRGQVADVEAKLTHERNAVARNAAADALTSDLNAIERAMPTYINAAQTLADALDGPHWHFEMQQAKAFIRDAQSQIEIAIAFSLGDLRSTVEAIRLGNAPIPAQKRVEPETSLVIVEPPPPTATIFLTRSVKFKNAVGKTIVGTQYTDLELSPHLASRALRCGAGVPLADARRKMLLNARGGDRADPRAPDILDLDAISDGSGEQFLGPDPVLRSANFTPYDRGPDRTLRIAP